MADGDTELPEKRRFDSLEATVEENKPTDISDSNKKQNLGISAGNSDNNGNHMCTSDGTMAESKEFRSIIASTEHEDDDDEEEDYDAEEDDSEEEGDGHSDEGTETVDMKGKGIVMNDKGKGKVLVDSDADSTDESDSNLSHGYDVSDVEDDLLAEIDLDNILPSRTRNRGAQPGLRISSNCDNKDTGA